MTRIYVVVEGQTEESFIKNLLAEDFWPHQIYLSPILLGVPGHKGGRVNYDRVLRDVIVQLKQDRAAYCSTMLDFYGLGRGFPGTPQPPSLTHIQKVQSIEQAVKQDICRRVPDLQADIRFIPYVQLHEYEGLLFSDPAAFAGALGKPELTRRFQTIRDEFDTPEDINNDPAKAPSKRVLQAYPSYGKVIDGTLAACAVGIATMQRECRHFRNWLGRLKALATTESARDPRWDI